MSAPVKSWFAVYTRSRNEKKVYELLCQAGIECYLPLKKRLKQWSDRKKWVEEPLFRSYLFVHVNPIEYHRVHVIPGFVRYITFEGKAVAVPDQQIEVIKRLLASDYELELSPVILPKGSLVQITAGDLIGTKGELYNYAGRKRVIIRIDVINQSLLINVPSGFIEAAE
jgi:transcriptional antiterminator RfaH